MKQNINILDLLGKPTSLYEKFHEKTKIKTKMTLVPRKNWPKAWKEVIFKEYPRLDNIILPEPSSIDHITLAEVLGERKSSRVFSQSPLTLEELSTLLYYSAGLRENKRPWIANRFYPSGGGRYPLEVYLISLNSELPKAVYHYNLRSHSLELLIDLKKINIVEYFNYDFVSGASCIVVITACFRRTTIKYKDRGYRFCFMECGHLSQNFYLNSSALNIKCCAVAGFVENKLNKLLDIEGVTETVIQTIALGK